MGDLTDFQREQIVGVHLAGASVTKMATLLRCIQSSSFHVMTAYTNHGKTYSAKRISGPKPKLCETYHYIMKRIVSKNHRTNAAEMTAEFNIHHEEPVSTKTV